MILPENTTIDTSNVAAMAVHGLTAFGKTSRPIVQNLGPGTLYLGTSATDLATRGIKLPVNAVYELADVLVEGAQQVFLRAVDDDCDVRIINVG